MHVHLLNWEPYRLSPIVACDSVSSRISHIKVHSATYILLRVCVGIVKEIRRTAIATCKASSWHKFGTGSYLLLWVQRKIAQMFSYCICAQSWTRTLTILQQKREEMSHLELSKSDTIISKSKLISYHVGSKLGLRWNSVCLRSVRNKQRWIHRFLKQCIYYFRSYLWSLLLVLSLDKYKYVPLTQTLM